MTETKKELFLLRKNVIVQLSVLLPKKQLSKQTKPRIILNNETSNKPVVRGAMGCGQISLSWFGGANNSCPGSQPKATNPEETRKTQLNLNSNVIIIVEIHY